MCFLDHDICVFGFDLCFLLKVRDLIAAEGQAGGVEESARRWLHSTAEGWIRSPTLPSQPSTDENWEYAGPWEFRSNIQKGLRY